MDPFDEMERARRGRRILTFAAGVALVLFVGFAVFPSLMGGGDDNDPIEGEVASVVVGQEDLATVSPLAAGDVIETFEVFGGKNPFAQPLSLPSVPVSTPDPDDSGGSGSGADAGSGSDSGAGAADPDDSSTPGATVTTLPAAPSDSEQSPTRGQAVALLDVFDDSEGTKAQIRVGSTAYLVAEGDVFATSYKVVSLDLASGCGQFLFGDSSFDLCKGQEILK